MKRNFQFGKRLTAAALTMAITAGMCSAMAADITIVDSDEISVSSTQTQASKYTYVYAGLTWEEYWKSEGIDLSGSNWTASSDVLDAHNEYDKGAYDAVTRATTNHGLHRGSYQCTTVIYDTNGNTYNLSHWSEDGKTMILTDGTEIPYSKGTMTLADGTTATVDHYQVLGIKYVPVRVATDDYADFCSKYTVVENGGTLVGGYGEVNLAAYSLTSKVTSKTNGLKYATKNSDGTYTFKARKTGTDSGIDGQALATQAVTTADQYTEGQDAIYPEVKEASGSYGEFLRVDLKGSYGALGAKMYAVRWDYYGNSKNYKKVIASYGTKFAADNWMHKSMSIQLGLTDSLRCQLPEGYDGTGYWKLTVYAMGYKDVEIKVQATAANIAVDSDEPADTTKLAEAIAKAEALDQANYTETNWANVQAELQEAKDVLAMENPTQPVVNEAISHLTAAMEEHIYNLKNATVKLSKTTYKYNGKAKKPSVTVKMNGKKLAKKNYTVKYKNNKKVGTASVVITGKKGTNYAGTSKTVTFKIKK